MKFTADEIAQKRFPAKFRGVDPVDVKDFLELLARQTFELQEQLKAKSQKVSDQEKELELAAADKKSFEDVIEVYKDNIASLKTELGEHKGRASKLGGDYDQIKGLAERLQQERETLKTELSRAQTRLSEVESKARMSQAALEELRRKIVVLEAENTSLKTESRQHQQAADEARKRTDELVEKAKAEAARFSAAAKEEIEQLRREAAEDIYQLKDDLEKLQAQRSRLRDEMRALLRSHLDRLDEFSAEHMYVNRSDHDDLFQKIEFTELAAFEEDDLRREFDQDSQEEAEAEESEESLRSKLEDGGIRYLSDE